MRRKHMLAVAVLLVLAGTVRAEEIENPEFTTWSKFKTGTSVTTTATVITNGVPSEQIVTLTLVEVAADKVAVTTEVVIKTKGQVLKPNALRQEIPKTQKLKKGEKKEDVRAGRPAGTVAEGTETLKVAGTEIKAHWFRFKTDTAEGTVWVSADVPGRVVKSVRTEGGEVPVTSTLELTTFKKP